MSSSKERSATVSFVERHGLWDDGRFEAAAKAEALIHPGSTATVGQLLTGYLPTLTPAMVAAIIPLLHAEVPATPAISSQAYQIAANFHKSTGLFPNPPSYGSIIDSSLISAAIGQAGS